MPKTLKEEKGSEEGTLCYQEGQQPTDNPTGSF